MKLIVDSDMMRKIEKETIEHYGIDAAILMERAALSVAERVMKQVKETKKGRILCICGTGNNGGDGIAAARILKCRGYDTSILILGEIDKSTDLTKKQLSIAEKLNVKRIFSLPTENVDKNPSRTEYPYDIIIDALFGIGLSRSLDGIYYKAVQYMNNSGSYIISVDIPSGISADTGAVHGEAVMADETVTFGLCKLGLFIYKGSMHAGKVITADIGIPESVIHENIKSKTMPDHNLYDTALNIPAHDQAVPNLYRHYEKTDIPSQLPKRTAYSNKGTYGKVLIAAGSKDSPGAAYLSASAAYHTGAGLVKVLSVEAALSSINMKLPEALTTAYNEIDYEKRLSDSMLWADVVMAGPGLLQGILSSRIVELIIKTCTKPLVLDADALNIISVMLNKEGIHECDKRISRMAALLPPYTVLTPHLKELSRLLNISIENIKGNLVDIAYQCTYNNKLIYVIKDAKTIISSMHNKYINLSGNNGMATGGSGDVLAGMIAGFLAGGLGVEAAASFGVYIHGLAGDEAAAKLGVYSMLAEDIIKSLPKVLTP